jgi:hypothetical protein
MKISEYLFSEYKLMTTKYVAASQQMREMLPRFTRLPQTDKVPTPKVTKELLREMDKLERSIEDALMRSRNIRHTLLDLL